MDLFNNEIDGSKNLLPRDGIVNYYEKLLTNQEANLYFDCLINTTEWKNDQAIIYGKQVITKRKVAWYDDTDFEYTYSKITKRALSWTSELLELKLFAEKKQAKNSIHACSTYTIMAIKEWLRIVMRKKI